MVGDFPKTNDCSRFIPQLQNLWWQVVIKCYTKYFINIHFPYLSWPAPPTVASSRSTWKSFLLIAAPLELSLERYKVQHKFTKIQHSSFPNNPASNELRWLPSHVVAAASWLLACAGWVWFPNTFEPVCPSVCCFLPGVPNGVPSTCHK